MRTVVKTITAVLAPKTSLFAWIWNVLALSYGVYVRNSPPPSIAYYSAIAVMLFGGALIIFGGEIATLANTVGYALIPLQSVNVWHVFNVDSIAGKTLFAAMTAVSAYLIYFLTYKLVRIRRDFAERAAKQWAQLYKEGQQ